MSYDQNVTPEVIFGSGNANGGFAVDRVEEYSTIFEVGLRAKLRFDENNQPQNVFNSNGDGTFSFETGAATGGPGWVASTTPIWNFEWSVNTDAAEIGATQLKLSNFNYELGIDFDPTAGTNFMVFDPIKVTYADHAFGDNDTNNGEGLVADNASVYASHLGNYHVVQNSWNMEFFNDETNYIFDPNQEGVYDFYLSVYDSTGLIASSSMQVLVSETAPVPIPAAAWLLGAGLLGLATIRRKLQQ